jgi:hypothetical protein
MFINIFLVPFVCIILITRNEIGMSRTFPHKRAVYVDISIPINKEAKFQVIFFRPPPLANFMNAEFVSIHFLPPSCFIMTYTEFLEIT